MRMVKAKVSIMILSIFWGASIYEAYAQPYLDTAYEFDTLVEGGKGIIVEDSAYIISGDIFYQRTKDTGSIQVGLMKVDFNGNKQWITRLDHFKYSATGLIHSLLKTYDNQYLVFGNINISPEKSNQGRIFKFNRQGDTLWSSGLGGARRDWFQQGLQTRDSSILAVGVTYNYGGREDFWLVKFSRRGKVIWEKHYGRGGTERPFSIIQTQDGGFLMMGRRSGYTVYDIYEGLIIKIDSAGNKEWSKVIGNKYGTAIVNAITYREDHILILGAQAVNDYYPANSCGLIAKLNLKGDILWKRKYCDPFIRWRLAKSTPVLPDGTIVVVGGAVKEEGRPHGYLMRLNPEDGNVIWQRTFEYNQYLPEFIYDMAVTPDGGFVITGTTWGTHSQDMWLAKLDSLGCDAPNCTTPPTPVAPRLQNRSKGNFHLAPNPASEKVTVYFPQSGETLPGGSIHIYDLTGREVRSAPVNQKVLQIKTHHLSRGLYLVQWVQNHEVKATRKLVVR